MTERLDRFQQAHRWAGFPIAVVYKYVDDQGHYLAALLTYYAFLSLFPLLLILSSVLGFVLQGDPELQKDIVGSAVGQFPVIGEQLGTQEGLRGSGLAITLGVLGALYGGLGVSLATQNLMNTAWAVPRNLRGNPLVARLRGLVLLLVAGAAVIGTTVLAGITSSAGAYGAEIGAGARALAPLGAVALNTAVLAVGFRVTTARRLGLGEVLPGAVGAAVVWQGLQAVGTAYVGYVVRNAGAVNGVFALVLGLIAWIYLSAVVVVLCVEVNVVRSRRLWPRALLTPFTDDVDLTSADRRSYEAYAAAQQHKGFESVEVSFEHDGQAASAKRRSTEDG